MNNIIERHPVYTLFTTIITTMTITWVVLTFVLDDNKVNFYKAQVENVKAETENVKSINSIYQARIDYLETENKKLEELNNYYLDWISKSTAPIPALKVQIQKVAEENNKLQKQYSNKIAINQQDTIKNERTQTENAIKYTIGKTIRQSEAYRDDFTDIVIGVLSINVARKATIQITFPDNTTKEEEVGAGRTFNFKHNKKDYQLIVDKIEYVFSYIGIQIVEK